jgi:hypothetical protein
VKTTVTQNWTFNRKKESAAQAFNLGVSFQFVKLTAEESAQDGNIVLEGDVIDADLFYPFTARSLSTGLIFALNAAAALLVVAQ